MKQAQWKQESLWRKGEEDVIIDFEIYHARILKERKW